jgi:hypothetical protein
MTYGLRYRLNGETIDAYPDEDGDILVRSRWDHYLTASDLETLTAEVRQYHASKEDDDPVVQIIRITGTEVVRPAPPTAFASVIQAEVQGVPVPVVLARTGDEDSVPWVTLTSGTNAPRFLGDAAIQRFEVLYAGPAS